MSQNREETISTVSYENLLRQGESLLENAQIPEARLDAWLLLEYATGISRAWYFAHREEPVNGETAAAYQELLKKRAGRIPLQHLTSQACFMGHTFYVDERVLIPRQDTECLVEAAIHCLRKTLSEQRMRQTDGLQTDGESVKETGGDNLRILDLCTGSGCILLSILSEFPSATGVGTDLSVDALEVAGKNAKKLLPDGRAVFVQSDLFGGAFFQNEKGTPGSNYHMLVSNPPYIPSGQIGTLMEEVRDHDPLLALDGGADGLFFYREITKKAPKLLLPGGYLLFEIGYDQGEAVAGLLKEAGFSEISVIQDLAGLDRVVSGRFLTDV